jgi:putative ABC transport system permease protein
MFGYYLELAVRSLRRNVALTILMIVAIAFGVGASMTTLTVMHVLSADPIPEKSDKLFYVLLEPRKLKGYDPKEDLTYQMTRADSENLLRAKRADYQAMMTGGVAPIEPQRADLEPFRVETRFTSADFFPLFDVPFAAGRGWSAEEDEKNGRVAVLAKPLAEKLFGTTDVVGKTIRVAGTELRITGVLDTWRPTPHFYDLNTGSYTKPEQLFVPFSTSRELKLDRSGSMNCWDERKGDPEDVGAPCEWIQFWVQLDSSAKVAAYRDFLVNYSLEQKRAGVYELDPNVRLHSVMDWLAHNEVVPKDVRLQTWIALGFLLVCLINTVGLLLTKFLRRASDIGVRRALGASKRSIFFQLLVEAGLIGLVGGLGGLALAWLGLWAVRQQPTDYAELAKLDLSMLATTFGLAVISSVLAGLLPAWRGCQVTPAIQLKSH